MASCRRPGFGTAAAALKAYVERWGVGLPFPSNNGIQTAENVLGVAVLSLPVSGWFKDRAARRLKSLGLPEVSKRYHMSVESDIFMYLQFNAIVSCDGTNRSGKTQFK